MKAIIFSVLFSCLCISSSFAQLIAGNVPAGMIVDTTSTHISLSSINTKDSVLIDIDCDAVNDFAIHIDHGNIAIDWPNELYIKTIDTAVSFCGIGTPAPFNPAKMALYYLGDTLSCSPLDTNWITSPNNNIRIAVLAMISTLPLTASNVYLAFKKNNQSGWIKISYDLQSSSITLDIHEVLTICSITTAIESMTELADILIYPNPSNGNTLQLQLPQGLSSTTSVSVHNIVGKEMTYFETVNQLHTLNISNYPKGTYFLKIKVNDQFIVKRFVRY